MSDFGNQIARACREAFLRGAGRNHPNTHPNAFGDLFRSVQNAARVRWKGRALVSSDEFDALVLEAASKWRTDKTAELANAFRRHQILVTASDGTSLRVSQRQDLENPAMFSGAELLDTPDTQVEYRLAHNHLLIYPECLPLLRCYAPPGHPHSYLDEKVDHFLFARKVNPVSVDLIKKELGLLQVITASSNDGGRWVIKKLPAPALAYFLVEQYLEVTGFRVDEGADAEILLQEINHWLYPQNMRELQQDYWQRQLRPEGKLIRFEAGGAQVRITGEDFTWLVSHGLVEPPMVGKLLKARGGEEEALTLLRDALTPVVQKNNPVNAVEYLAAFS